MRLYDAYIFFKFVETIYLILLAPFVFINASKSYLFYGLTNLNFLGVTKLSL